MATNEAIEQRLGEAPADEAVKERLEREHGELLEELRALIPGAQVLFGFLLAIRFTNPFTELNSVQRDVYYATLLTTAVSLVLLLAPSAYHRLRFRQGDKDAMVRKGNPGSDCRDGRHRPGLHRRAVPHHRSPLHHSSRDHCGARVLRADRVALVGDRAVPQGSRGSRGQGDLGRSSFPEIPALTLPGDPA